MSLRLGGFTPSTRHGVGLLGPCFKTGGARHDGGEVRTLARRTIGTHPTWASQGEISPSVRGHRSSTTISYTLHSLSRVLFNFPSRYLSSIGLAHVFSLRRDSPPALGCDPKQPDSMQATRQCISTGGNGAFTLSGSAFQSHSPPADARHAAQTTTRSGRFQA